MKKFDIDFLPYNIKVKVNKGETVLDAARRANIPIESICGGKGTCGKCKIKILTKRGFSEITEKENELLLEDELADGVRLACLTKVYGNVKLEVNKESIIEKFVKDKAKTKKQIEVLPIVSFYMLDVPPPSLSDTMSDFERIKEALEKKFNISVKKIDPLCFKYSPLVLRKENWKVNVVVWNDTEILDIRPKDKKEIYGVAIDIGTTTIGAYILSLKDGHCVSSGSILNPQIKFGEDIMSRIGYITEHKEKGLRLLNRILIESLNSLIKKLSREAKILKKDIFEVTIVGNTVMHHIFLNVNPKGLGVSPFVPFLSSSVTIKARNLGIKINPSGYVFLLPVKGGFVGGDCIGGVLALKPYLKDEIYLIIDIGTNGEIVVGNKKRLLCASCATGPALEGAHVKYGMRADIGAIERVFIDPDTKEVKYKVIGNTKPKGICGSGVIDAVSELFKSGIIENSGRFRKHINTKRLKVNSKTVEFVIAWSEETATGKDISITQEDIRNVQYAKASIYAGAKILLKKLGIEKPSKVMLAGAFGNYIDIENACILGMFPFSRLTDVIAVGNAAGEGAIFALLNKNERKEAELIAKKIEYVELTLCKEFQKEFLDALYIPHRIDLFFKTNHIQENY